MSSLSLVKVASLIALAATIVPGLLYFAELIDLRTVQWSALVGTIVWFVTAPLWMGRA